MIRGFRHKGLEQFFAAGTIKGINAGHAARLRRILTALHAAEGVGNMNQPGYRLHPLHGDREGQWAVWVSGNWRLVFAFDGSDAVGVDLVDYHSWSDANACFRALAESAHKIELVL
jgi:toxin HigB-1